jgi:hypothetical protein
VFGFYARPVRGDQGVLNLKIWDCGIRGKDGTIWADRTLKLTMAFPEGKISRSLSFSSRRSCLLRLTTMDASHRVPSKAP